jgi:hypothetical protein
MKKFVTLKAIVIVAASCVAFAAPASADHYYNHESKGEAVIGIIGGIIEGAIEQKEQEEEHARRCARWHERCEDGSDWACERYENRCD